ncbi:MAG: L-threonylcarbamoyladenylate synthase [Bacilli bacterium]|nr:L-threonylcarbamoyladenylate synthase [Bacilli bacterium]MDD3421950.1 L-threonylcarbamoyladenylate synthase [Bacilli bacterium]MDD4065634.1 L-threonylcarbamoyladenylate synthase [Bacilli bacterium]
MQTIIFEKKDYSQIIPLFFNDEVIAIPTDTVMGLACLARSEKAYQKLVEVKGRPTNKAFAMAVPSVDMLYSYGKINAQQRRIVETFLPGPLTIVVLKQENIQDYVTAGSKTIALRVVPEPVVAEVLTSLQEPILLTSANMSGQPSLLTSAEVEKVFNEKIRGIIAGDAGSGLATTVVDLTGKEPKILREGAISLKEIKEVWGTK